MAPALVASDSLSIANRCDASCLVVRALGEKRGLVGRLRNDLNDARSEFLGVVVNAVKPSAGGYIPPGVTLYHNGSADLVDAELEGERADVLVAGLAGRRGTENYVARLLSALDPKVVVPTHHDAFFAPLERGVHLLPGVDLDGFVSEVGVRAPEARVITPGYTEWVAVGERGENAVIPLR